MELDCRELQKLKELVPYETLAPSPDEIIKEIERLNNNWQQAVEDLTKIANELGLEEGSTIYDILDKLKELKEGDK